MSLFSAIRFSVLRLSAPLRAGAFAAALLSTMGCADSEPPTWPSAGELNSEDGEGNDVELFWPEATDNKGVTEYEIFVDGETLRTVPGSETHATITIERAAEVEVLARDEAGLQSERLRLRVSPPDREAPRWAAGAALDVEHGGGGDLLTWSEATDASAVEYVLKRGDEVLATTRDRTHLVPAGSLPLISTSQNEAGEEVLTLTPAGRRVTVIARDEAGNETTTLSLRDPSTVPVEEEAQEEAAQEEPAELPAAEAAPIAPVPPVLPGARIALPPGVINPAVTDRLRENVRLERSRALHVPE